MRPSGILIRSAVIAALGGLLFGFDTAVISGTTAWLKSGFVSEIAAKVYPLLPSISKESVLGFMLGFTVAGALIGTILGLIGVGKPTDAVGRRGILFALAALYFVSAVGCGLAWGWWSFMIFRFIGGLAVGGALVVSPMYIAEISPARYRGRSCSFHAVQHRVGHPAGLPVQLCDRQSSPRYERVPLDVRRDGRAFRRLLRLAVLDS